MESYGLLSAAVEALLSSASGVGGATVVDSAEEFFGRVFELMVKEVSDEMDTAAGVDGRIVEEEEKDLDEDDVEEEDDAAEYAGMAKVVLHDG